ncbi:NCS2 family permease [Photobacterium profundum]|uniref:Guanine-hypoxanthine permease n=1 Tax=Photobacterium profundum 3TCK TaxID=314280 RepID=Q1YXC0_9GAMM|nr:NCS2 family permease [Photobacterium profundum]EAS40928.1 Guanine-hypoxanthine permease [Photobacterium profundum 3TCK]PSV63633.1 NCS2 family permease [Photobacterium profundum]
METVVKKSTFSLAKWFDFQGNKTNLKNEVIGGFTTFATMAYMVAVVPGMLSKGGLPFDTALTITVLMTVLTTVAMGIYTNRPFVLGPGLGSVAIFSFTLLGNDVPLSIASGIVFISGVLFMLVSFLGVRDFIVRIIPHSVKVSVGVGIGLFIALLGFKQAGVIIADPKKNVLIFGDLAATNTLVAMLGFFLVLFFVARKIQGGIIIAILLTTLISLPLGITSIPDSFFSMPGSIDSMFLQLDVMGALSPAYLPFLLAFFIPDFFSTLGTLLGVGSQAGYLDKDGNLPGIEKNFHVDSCATTFGALFSCPVLTTYVESSAGVEAGGRTGFTAIVTAGCFALTLFLAPLAGMIPTAATAPVLMYIGISMMGSMKKVNYDDITEYLPAFVCVAMSIFSFNAGNGIAAAMLVYAFLKLATGRYKEDHWSVYVIAASMIYYFYIVASH